jgi:radical SAM superfamily enzyme YgiQ (UPF0313 family)
MTYLKENMPDCQVKYIKIAEIENDEKYIDELKSYGPDIIGFPCYTIDFFMTYQLMKRIKKTFSQSHICCGGPHINLFPKETLALPEVNSIVMGDGEKPFFELCNSLIEGLPIKAEGVYTKDSLKEEHVFTPYFYKDINTLPVPGIKLLDDYLSYTSFLTRKPLATVVTSRGCPFVCNYCSSKTSKYRMINIEKVMETIDYYVSLGVHEFEFWDETFNPSINRLRNFAEELRKRKHPITFAIRGAVVQNVNFESLKALKEVGLRRIQFGIETTSKRLLQLLNKKIDKKKISEAISLCNRLRISSVANIMIGLPTQTESEIMDDFELLKKIGPTYISISIFNYAPHTEFYKEYIQKNGNNDFWRSFAENPQQDIVLRHCEDIIPRDRLYQLQSLLARKYYFRPLYLLKYLSMVPRDELLISTRLGLRMLLNRF